ncbi:MAG: FecR domain-containing protein [Verrucomicrobiota bacterium]
MKIEPQDTERLLSYLAGELGVDDVRALEERLLAEEDLRTALLNLSIEESVLVDWAKTERVSVVLDNGVFGGEKENVSGDARGRAFSDRVRASGWWAAAAVFALSLVGLAWMGLGKGGEAQRGVADYVASIDASWRGETPVLNASMAVGPYELDRGSVDLLFAEGARVSVSGPARFELRSARHIHLDSGNLVAQISDEALGFIVTSPQSEVVDLGTEFGLSVDKTGRTDVHVLDGLVEVLPVNKADPAEGREGVMIAEGEARRFGDPSDGDAIVIPVSSRSGLVGDRHVNGLGVRMLRGSVRVADGITQDDLRRVTEGRNWIDLIVERRGVVLTEALDVSIQSPGSYRDFTDLQETVGSGESVDSYLLHFRPNSTSEVRGVIQFDRPIVAVLCSGEHLGASDSLFGVPSVYYPSGANSFRGLEPHGTAARGLQGSDAEEWQPDEIVLSQDRMTLSIRTFAGVERGFDQIRILTEVN